MTNRSCSFAKHLIALSVLSAALLPGVAHAGAERQSQAQYGGTYRVPLVNEPITFDPALYTDINSVNVATNLFDGLVQFDKDLKVVPAIASMWKISRDHRTYTFMLEEGVTFHNGREVTAEDFVFSFTRLLDPATKSPAASFFLNIKGATAYREGRSPRVTGLSAPQPHMLKIELEEPFAPFLSILAMANAKVVPAEALGPQFGQHPVGTGPFRFEAWEPGQYVVLAANPDYFAGRPFLDSLRFPIYPNETFERIFADFQQGLLEHALIPRDQYDRFVAETDTDERYTIISKSGLNIVYVGMNTSLAPFDDVRVRQAINYAVDTRAITRDITRRGSTPARGLLPPGIAGFDPDFQGYGYAPQRARALLAKAGYPEGRGFPPIQLWTVSKADNVHQQLAAYQRYLGEVGLTVEIRVATNWKAFVQAIGDNQAGLFYAAWYADYPDPDNFFYPLAYSKSRTNRMRFDEPQVDQLLDEARGEMDYLKRAALYQDIEKLVMHSAPVVAQHINSSNYLFQSRVRGAQMSRLGALYLPFHKIWFDREPSTSRRTFNVANVR